MRRRALLTAAGATTAGFLTGCTGGPAVAEAPTVRFSLDPLPDAALPGEVLYTIDTAAETDADARLMDRILDGGTTTKGLREPLPPQQHLLYDDHVYELAADVVDTTPGTSYSVKVDVVTGSVNDDTAIRFSDLPDVDQEQLEAAGLADGDPVGIGTSFHYTDTERDASVLVPDSAYEYITWADGAEAEWVVDDAYDAPLHTYRYTAETIGSASEYGRRMRERFAFPLTDLSAQQTEFVETAISDEHYIVGPDETPPDAFVALADQFRDHEQAHALNQSGEGDLSGPYLVRYDEDVYWTVLVVHGPAFDPTTAD
ncbi:hypothetical protein [Halorubellus salinus]|uniref:hypothetical protein n=1 Tax=Halorubellus salinus TaxID=755309 RepID=UPI001D08609C|nr:hypothetical protein [Halorubellus salinus]